MLQYTRSVRSISILEMVLNSQPEHQLQPHTQQSVKENHTALAESMRRLSEKKPSEKNAAEESGRHITHIFNVAVADFDKVLNHPTCAQLARPISASQSNKITYLQQ